MTSQPPLSPRRIETLLAWVLQKVSSTPQLPAGDPVNQDERADFEISAAKFLQLQVFPAPRTDDYATFSSEIAPQWMFEIHTTDNQLQPYSFESGGYRYYAPALRRLVGKGVRDFHVIFTAHPPKLDPLKEAFKAKMEWMAPEMKAFMTRLLYHLAPTDKMGITRNLWIQAPGHALKPQTDGTLRGLGGRQIMFDQAGDLLSSIVNRRPPRWRRLEMTDVGNPNLYHLEYALPEAQPGEGLSTLEIDGVHYRFWRGGQIDNSTFPALMVLDVDIKLRLEFIEGTSLLFITPLLRSSKTNVAELDSLSEKLTDLGGWKPFHRETQTQAFVDFIGARPLPRSYGRRQLKNWSNIDPENGPLGVLQQLATSLAAVGDPKGRYTPGKAQNLVPYTMNPGPSTIITGSSELTGKSGTAATLAPQLGDTFIWLNCTASRLDGIQAMIPRIGGKTWLVDALEAESLFRNRYNRRPNDDELRRLQVAIDTHDNDWVEIVLQRIYSGWESAGKLINVPLVLHPRINTSRYIHLLAKFTTRFPKISQDWLFHNGQKFCIVSNDVSHLLQLKSSSKEYDRQAAQDLAEAIAWFANQGLNHGLLSITTTHSHHDLDDLLGRSVYVTFAHHLEGGLLGFANYEFDLKAPATGEVEAHLDMRVRDHQLLDYVDRLTPQEAEAFEAAYTLPEIFQPPYELDLDEIFPELVIIQDVIHKNGTGKTADFGEQADTQPVSAEQTQKVPVAKDPGDPQNE